MEDQAPVFEFDQDTQLTPQGEGEWSTVISDRWNITTIPNGGFVFALILGAVTQTSAHPDPLSATAHFLGKTEPGPARIVVQVLKEGRSLSTVEFGLFQQERLLVKGLVTLGNLSHQLGPTRLEQQRPDLGPPSKLITRRPNLRLFPMSGQFDYQIPADKAEGILGEPTGQAQISAKLRFADGREPDLNSLALFADALPPAVFQLGYRGWTPTIELTIHFRAHPVPGWIWSEISTSFLEKGLLEEDGRLWDEVGQLVALSRQLAIIPSDPQHRMI